MASDIAVVFDLDGVLIDSATYWKQVDSSFLRKIVPTWSDELQRSIHGMGIFSIYELLRREHELLMSQEEFFEYYRALAREIYTTKVTLYPGVPDVLKALSEASIPCAIASSSATEWIEVAISRFGLRDYFSACVGPDLVGGEGKPSPKVYLEAARWLDVSPARCVAVEDTDNGAMSAKEAGMYCLGFRNGLNSALALDRVDREIVDLTAITPDLIRSVATGQKNR